jgi:hypothetical protein
MDEKKTKVRHWGDIFSCLLSFAFDALTPFLYL